MRSDIRHCHGDIVLMHDTVIPSTINAALRIVDILQAQGYVFVTVDELFRIKGVTPRAGVAYGRVS